MSETYENYPYEIVEHELNNFRFHEHYKYIRSSINLMESTVVKYNIRILVRLLKNDYPCMYNYLNAKNLKSKLHRKELNYLLQNIYLKEN